MPESVWTTRADPAHTRRFGVEELHQAFFEPPGWPGKGAMVSLGVPECELILSVAVIDGEPAAFVNRPQRNRNVKLWTRVACEEAAQTNALLILACDTWEQVEIGARRVGKLLPRYRRVAAERMDEPQTRARDGLS
jgi:hypothetical protein